MRATRSREAALLLHHALGYAYRGWPVLPLRSHSKIPLLKKGVLDASPDPMQVGEWWARWPTANIGLRTGVTFDVLDIDGEAGVSSLDANAGSGASHPGPVSRTGKGQHWLYRPGGTANRAGLLPSIDWRGTNGYIVAPPSIHPDGHTYAWDEDHGPDTPLPEPPDWLLPHLFRWTDRGEYKPREHVFLATNPHQRKRPQRFIVLDPERLAAETLVDIIELAHERGWNPQPDGGGRYKIHCPFHSGDREPSMKLYPEDNTFKCFGCGVWGHSVNLAMGQPNRNA